MEVRSRTSITTKSRAFFSKADRARRRVFSQELRVAKLVIVPPGLLDRGVAF